MIMYENIHMSSCSGVNCYVLRGSEGDVLIDTGRERNRKDIEVWLMNYNIRLIILTHGHADSIQNAGYFSELFDAPIMVSPYDMRIARENGSRPYYITNPAGYIFKSKIKSDELTPMNYFEPKIYAEEGMDLMQYGIDGVIVNLEGHTKGSLGVLHKSSVGVDLYAGDAVSTIPMPMFPATAESPLRAKETIEKIITLSPDRIFTSHGKPICCGDKSYKLFIDRF